MSDDPTPQEVLANIREENEHLLTRLKMYGKEPSATFKLDVALRAVIGLVFQNEDDQLMFQLAMEHEAQQQLLAALERVGPKLVQP